MKFSSNAHRQICHLVKQTQGVEVKGYSHLHSALHSPVHPAALLRAKSLDGFGGGKGFFLQRGFLAHTSSEPKDTPRLKMMSLKCF